MRFLKNNLTTMLLVAILVLTILTFIKVNKGLVEGNRNRFPKTTQGENAKPRKGEGVKQNRRRKSQDSRNAEQTPGKQIGRRRDPTYSRNRRNKRNRRTPIRIELAPKGPT